MNSPPENINSVDSKTEESSERFTILFERVRNQLKEAFTDPVTNCKLMGLAGVAFASKSIWDSSITIYPTIDKNMAFLGLIGIVMATAGQKFFERLQR